MKCLFALVSVAFPDTPVFPSVSCLIRCICLNSFFTEAILFGILLPRKSSVASAVFWIALQAAFIQDFFACSNISGLPIFSLMMLLYFPANDKKPHCFRNIN